jgi:hypothetical protein
MAEETLRCPKCWLSDRVHKVSSVYAPGSATGQTDLKGAGQALLNQRLEPPPRPRKPRVPGLLVALAAVALLVGGINLTIGLRGSSSQLGVPDFAVVAAAGRVFVVAGVFALAVCAFLVVSVILAYRRNHRRFTQEFIQWERRMDVWNRLCYCARDDGVFLPGHREFLKPKQLHAFLSRSVGQAATTQAHLRH